MNNIEYKSINDVPNYIKLHILKLNIKFIETCNRFSVNLYPKYPEAYDNIIYKKKNGNFIIYGELYQSKLIDITNVKEIKLIEYSECFIDNDKVLKNRYGDDDCIGA